MTNILLIGTLAALVPLTGLKAAESKVAAGPATAETAQDAIANLEIHIAQREQRLTEWGKDIVELDARIEKRVDELVKLLSGMNDSASPGGKVSELKQEAIAGLKRGMDAYAGKRREVAENIRSGDTASAGDLDKFDERINKRVDQIAELTKSVPTQQDSGNVESDGASYWNGYFFENIRLSEEGKQKARAAASKNSSEDTAKSLKQGIERLDKRRASLRSLLSKRKTQAEKQLYSRELGKLDAYKDHLKEQLRDVTMASVQDGKPIATEPTHDIAQLLDDARGDLREDVSRLFRTYDQFARGRTYVSQLKANLAARNELRAKNPPAEKPAD